MPLCFIDQAKYAALFTVGSQTGVVLKLCSTGCGAPCADSNLDGFCVGRTGKRSETRRTVTSGELFQRPARSDNLH